MELSNNININIEEVNHYEEDNEEQKNEEKIEIKEEQEKKIEECIELKNIKYKTMLLNGNPLKETKVSNNLSNLEKFLEDEKNNNKKEPWCKLDKTVKIKKIIDFVELYKVEKDLDEEEKNLLVSFLKDCLDKKKLIRVKDVVYDKTNELIKEIPALSYTKMTKHFTLKNIDKRVSTLKSLPPKKTHAATIKKKVDVKDDSDTDDEN